MAEKELELEDGGKKKKLILIVVVALVLIGGGVAGWLFMGSSEETSPEQTMSSTSTSSDSAAPAASTSQMGTALYVAMPRPFVFNVPGSGRDRIVEIKVQLLVRGSDNEETAKMHIPMIEGTLLKVFSSANADDLVTEAGKVAIREQAVKEVKAAMKEITDREVVSQVLFTGFVMQ
ncbi:flagellar basal body-associated protein FliL [Lacimicrobium alkaliphilum]|uniref:Flagellar protein FliL n=1 Tax=Lacimicrobium alkaliphilum TaxID=1526571 RepID=A0ABQ1RM15_9ALTE|nr:flagellar basal body-associated protein FliL [Lacimicrobium alkaliphilum]GGD72785.1 flagellar basal body-associated protein FliL [Lacimicrobium alkaliphilum]